MFRIEMLPAAHGDCLWIEYGSGSTVHRILIDGGPAHAYPALRERILHLPADERRFDLLVITHIDADHIEGIIRLLLDAEMLAWHLQARGVRGARFVVGGLGALRYAGVNGSVGDDALGLFDAH